VRFLRVLPFHGAPAHPSALPPSTGIYDPFARSINAIALSAFSINEHYVRGLFANILDSDGDFGFIHEESMFGAERGRDAAPIPIRGVLGDQQAALFVRAKRARNSVASRHSVPLTPRVSGAGRILPPPWHAQSDAR
jgi:hypothetical protein